MVSEWEDLEKLSKDELIMELVRSRWRFRNLQKVIAELSRNMGDDCAYEPGQKPSEEWASKIADYASSKGSFDLLDWGVDDETSFRYCNDHFDDSSDA